MTIRKLMVPTDFSKCADRAGELALKLAKRFDAEVLFLHLFPDPVGSLHVPRNFEVRLATPDVASVKAGLDRLVRHAEHEGVNAKGVLVYDRGGDSIEDYAESYQVDMIIMGTHGLHGLAEWLRASNAQTVTRRTDIPVLVVKEGGSVDEIRDIVFASSFEENVFAPMLFISDLARAWNATIHLFYVNPAIHSIELAAARRKMLDLANQFPDLTFTTTVSETNDEEFAINKFAAQVDADLITLTPHDRDGVVKMFSHTIAENLVNHADLPVLVLPED